MICSGLCCAASGDDSFQAKVDQMKKKEIPRMILELRKAMGLTQEQFAAKVGVTFSTVNRWENGRGKPSPLAMKHLRQIAEEHGVDL